MNIVTGLVVYVIVWWTVLFAVLPWGIRSPDQPTPGEMPGAPARPRLLLKFAVTTVLAGAVWLVIYGMVASGVISFRDMAREL